jgi:microcystin-dependent protein
MPLHTHAVNLNALTATAQCSPGAGNRQTPVGNVPAVQASGMTTTYSNAAPDANMNPAAIALGGSITAAVAGSSQSHENRQPHLALNYCIALQGIFPSRS